MKLIRFGTIENEKPGVILENGEWVDTSSFGEDYDEQFFNNDGLSRLKSWLDEKAENLPKIDKNNAWLLPLKNLLKLFALV